MAFTFTPVAADVVKQKLASKAFKASEPRDTIELNLIRPFLDAVDENGDALLYGCMTDENGDPAGFTWQLMEADTEGETHLSAICDMVTDKAKSVDDAGITKVIATINQQNNRKRWHVFAKRMKEDSGEVSFMLINETRESELNAAEKAAKAETAKAASK